VIRGKLVRDRIPDIVSESGRRAEVRYLEGTELVAALAAKLCEEAAEATAAIGDRDSLVEELADVTEVMSALMALNGIGQQEVTDAALQKTSARGGFETGAWLVADG
jgi:predicted house-cleaning noncanonical NTP pyrophosphatase (MazG superfamily)